MSAAGLWVGPDRHGPGGVVEGRLDARGSATVAAAVDALARPMSADDARTLPQRRADALVELCRRHLDGGGLPDVGGQRPHVLLHVTPEGLHGMPGASPAWLDGVGPVSSATAAQVCCDADVTVVSFSRNGDVLDVGRSQRLPTPRSSAAP